MSKVKEALDQLGVDYLTINDEIKALEEKKKAIQAKMVISMPEGFMVGYRGSMYEWVAYERSSKSWKGLYTEAYKLLDDQSQVLIGEAEINSTKTSTHHKFAKLKN